MNIQISKHWSENIKVYHEIFKLHGGINPLTKGNFIKSFIPYPSLWEVFVEYFESIKVFCIDTDSHNMDSFIGKCMLLLWVNLHPTTEILSFLSLLYPSPLHNDVANWKFWHLYYGSVFGFNISILLKEEANLWETTACNGTLTPPNKNTHTKKMVTSPPILKIFIIPLPLPSPQTFYSLLWLETSKMWS